MTATDEAITGAKAAANAASEKLAEDIVVLDVSDVLVLTDTFVLCTVKNQPQARAVSDAVEEQMYKLDSGKPRREGESEGRWILLDFGDVVIHIQQEQERVHYALERLWKDCPVIDWRS